MMQRTLFLLTYCLFLRTVVGSAQTQPEEVRDWEESYERTSSGDSVRVISEYGKRCATPLVSPIVWRSVAGRDENDMPLVYQKIFYCTPERQDSLTFPRREGEPTIGMFGIKALWRFYSEKLGHPVSWVKRDEETLRMTGIVFYDQSKNIYVEWYDKQLEQEFNKRGISIDPPTYGELRVFMNNLRD